MNEIIHGNFLDNSLPDKCANLIIADPPYFEVKGDFDFIWPSFDDYLKVVEKWAIECKRILADNGTLFWWGHAKKIAYAQIIFDKYFNLENNLVWEKKDSQTLKNKADSLRSFAPITERVLMYSNEIGMSALENLHYNVSLWDSIIMKLNKNVKSKKQCFDLFRKDGRYTSEASLLVQTKYKFGWGSRFELMDEKLFNICKDELLFDFTYDEILKEYIGLKNKLLKTIRPFNLNRLATDVLNFSQESHITGKYQHDTVKPETLTRYLILACSIPNDLVIIPFAGSGTECAMALKEGRNFIGYEIEKKYAEMANNRCSIISKSPQLF